MRKANPCFCICQHFNKLLLFYFYGRPSRFKMAPFFYDIFYLICMAKLIVFKCPHCFTMFLSLRHVRAQLLKMPPFHYKVFHSSTFQSLAFFSAHIVLQFFQLMRKEKRCFCNWQRFNKFLVYHSYGTPSRLEMPPLFYNVYISSAWQSLAFLYSPIFFIIFPAHVQGKAQIL